MKDALNIFTDASISHTDTVYGTIGCAGFISARSNDENKKLVTLDRYYTILTNTTNNIAEVTAILKAVQYAIAHKNMYREFNIFSDSQWAIKSITTWIFNWINTIDDDGIMYNSSQAPVINQNIFSEIILLIVQNDIKIHFYHCKGHVDTKDKNSIFDAIKTFRISNCLKRDQHLTYEDIYIISYYNDLVDNESRAHVQHFVKHMQTQIPMTYRNPFFYILDEDIVDRYKSLIK